MKVFSEAKYRQSIKDLSATGSRDKVNVSLVRECKDCPVELGYCVGRDGQMYGVALTWCKEVDS